MNSSSKLKTQTLVMIGLITAVTSILAPIAIPLPFSPVPISFTNLILMISVYILGWKFATISYILYLLIGLVGLPVFSGFTGGLGKLAGPTGGYLIGFIALTLIAGWFVETFPNQKILSITGMIIGMVIPYLLGTIWLCMQLNVSLWKGLAIGVFPYLLGDGIKIIIAVIIGPTIKGRLLRLSI